MSEQMPPGQPWQPPGGASPQQPPGGASPQQPPYGEAPQAPPPQAPLPQGQPPQGQQPYATAPYGAAPQDPGPTPKPVRIAMILLLVQIGLSVVNSIVFLPSTYQRVLARQPAQPGTDPELMRSMMAAVAVATIVISVIALALWALFVVMAWRGRNWARVVLTVFIVLSLFSVLFTPVSIAQGSMTLAQLPFVVINLGISIAALVLLWREPAKGWYTALGAYKRATGSYPRR